MASGLSNKLAGQIGEFLTCAELGRRGLAATTFTGNVPEYDLIVCDDRLHTIPIQVKTTRSESWPSRANYWLTIEFDESTGQQVNLGPQEIQNPDLIFVCVALGQDRQSD